MPKLHYFNPGHENAVLNCSPYYMPPTNTKRMMIDLALLPAWYGNENDLTIIQKELNEDFKTSLASTLFSPQTITSSSEIVEKLSDTYEATPWGISPQSIHYYETLFKGQLDLIRTPVWSDDYPSLCSRATANKVLNEIIKGNPTINHEIQPIAITDISYIKTIVQSKKNSWIIKAPFSSSGRGLLWIQNQTITIPNEQWISGAIKKQGFVTIEPALDKQIDFAMGFFANGLGEITFHGLSLFETEELGGYVGNYLGKQSNIKAKLLNYINDNILEETKKRLEEILHYYYGKTYCGYLGVDMMIYKDEIGNYHIHPCVEINMRYTMGIVAIELSSKLLAPESEGLFQISFTKDPKETLKEHTRMIQKHPAKFIDNKLSSGYFSLCPIDSETQYRAYVLIK